MIDLDACPMQLPSVVPRERPRVVALVPKHRARALEVNAEIVEALELYLARARAGEVTTIAIAAAGATTTHLRHVARTHGELVELAGLVHRTLHRINGHLDALEEPV